MRRTRMVGARTASGQPAVPGTPRNFPPPRDRPYAQDEAS